MTRATLRYSQGSPTKVRLVLDQIRGLDVTDARELLRFSPRGAAVEVAKLLDSAIANAEHNDHISSDELFVSGAWADGGPTQKRFRPRARGRGTRIRKRTSHITVVVDRYSDDDLRARAVSEEAAGVGVAAERRRRLTRGRRVAASTAAEAHDHDHDHEDDDVESAVDTLDASNDVSGEDETPVAASSADEAAEADAPDAGDGESDVDESDDSSKGAK